MSYILDALKKIEHEKIKKARPDGRVSISGDLFQERKQPPSRGGLWKVLALIAAASLITGAGTWFILQKSSRKSSEVIPLSSVPPPATPVNPSGVTPAIPAPVQSRVSSVVVPPAAPSAAVTVVQENAETVAGDGSSAREVRRSIKQAKPRPASPKQPAQTIQPAQTVQAPADMKLSGIAWQDERTARRAVVNGFLLKEGAVVSGAKIIDIQSDRVRFSSAAGLFEIKLDAVLPVEVKK